jgi:BirA family biotin operon repressor/biotin-[acetyl-CoA-carboxylase] ligase
MYGRLRIRTVGRVLREFESLDSTNRLARELAVAGEAEGTVVIAGEQTAGRGRLGRDWVSPAGGGLYMSVILRPEEGELAARERLSIAAGVAVLQVLRRLYGLDAMLKWPNDVLINGKKVCGILIEAGQANEFIVGIGINTNREHKQFSQDEYRHSPTALSLELGERIDHVQLLERILESLDLVYAALRRGLFRAILGRARRHLYGRGREVAFEDGFGARRSATLEGLDDEGRALVRDGYDRILAITAGEVQIVDRA